MKKSTIIEIFHGHKGNMGSMRLPKEYFEKGDERNNIYDELKEKLSPETFNLHEKYISALETDYLDEVDFYFAEGFKLGLSIGLECKDD